MSLRSVQVAIGVFIVNIPLAFLFYALGLYLLAIITITIGTTVIYGIAFGFIDL